jgi:hypothetical protein
MMPVLWVQHEVNNSYIYYNNNPNVKENVNIKYASEIQFKETKNFELFLFGILLCIRALLPRQEDWNWRSGLDLIM